MTRRPRSSPLSSPGSAREAVQARGGSVIELRGDEALAVFPSARQAVAAAIDLQERLVDETIDDPELPMPAGVGLDAGEGVPLEGGYRGGALNLAARLCGQAGPGEILASRSVTHLARRVEGVRYVDRGKVQLKNLTDPVEVVRIVPEGVDPAERLRTALPPPGRASRRSRAKIMIAAAVALAIAVAATIVLLPGDAQPTIAAGAVGLLNPSGGLEGTVDVGEFPRGLASGAGSLWVADHESSRLFQVDPSTFEVEERIQVGAGPTGVAIASGLVWVTNTDERTVSMVDPQALRVVQTVVVGNGPAGIVADGERVWVANSVDATVTEIDATDGRVVDTHPVGERPVALAAADGAVWVANASDGTVSRVVSGDGETGTTPVGRGPAAIASAFGSLWVANAEDGTVTTIDHATGSTTTERFGEGADAIASAGSSIWVASAREGTIVRIDPATKETDSFEVGNEPRALTGVEGGLWVGVEASPTVHRGGTLRLVAERPVEIDPHVGEFVSTAVLASTYDGLVTYRRAGGAAGLTVVPDLAVSLPVPTDGGLTYTFTLRDGIRFSNGHTLGPQDVVATFERVLVGNKYGRGYMSELVGWSTCSPEDPAACDLSRGVVPDEEAGTVTFHLVRPAPSFLKILATSVFAIVPAGTPIHLKGEPIPATGPYLIDDAGQDGSVVLERNPTFREWSADAQPDGFADRIEVVTGIDPSEQVRMVEQEEADFAFGGVPFDLVEELDRRASDQLVRSPWPSIMALGLNTAKPPFDNVNARRAVAFALERSELVRALTETSAIKGGDVTAEEPAVNCQILPPSTPGYAPYCPYSDRARRWTGHGQGRILTGPPAGPALWDSGCEGDDRHVTVPAVDCCVGQGHARRPGISRGRGNRQHAYRRGLLLHRPFVGRGRLHPGLVLGLPLSCAVPGAPPLVRAAERVAPLRGRARRDGYRGLFIQPLLFLRPEDRPADAPSFGARTDRPVCVGSRVRRDRPRPRRSGSIDPIRRRRGSVVRLETGEQRRVQPAVPTDHLSGMGPLTRPNVDTD